jgi:hypothetical protein
VVEISGADGVITVAVEFEIVRGTTVGVAVEAEEWGATAFEGAALGRFATCALEFCFDEL